MRTFVYFVKLVALAICFVLCFVGFGWYGLIPVGLAFLWGIASAKSNSEQQAPKEG